MRLMQILTEGGERAVVATTGPAGAETSAIVPGHRTVYDLARAAIAARSSIEAVVDAAGKGESVDRAALLASGRVLAPIDHPDPAHLLITGTGLTHLGSASARDAMHKTVAAAEETLTDSMKMFRMGLEGGKPAAGKTGVQPEWFYKGDGALLVGPGQPLTAPSFAQDGGEEPEVAGIYIIADDGRPFRIGFALANEFSDHVMERVNYLYLAHSKLRPCSVGPELLVGALPDDVRGRSRILRDDKVIFDEPFLSGEANMSHTLANLEHHHFKYDFFRRPGQVHVHTYGTATLSVAFGIRTEPGDVFEIESEAFGLPLRNALAYAPEESVTVTAL
ncbi:MAG: FAH family protein [Bosea sp.]|nr:FAH family protein [Bosea sp. (in: a-proteobacteria)]